LRRVFTGVKGLDKMLGGGFPKGRVILVCGGPGAGKTILSLQYLIANAERGEPGVYVTFEEPINLIKQNVKSFGWNLERLEREDHLRVLNFCMVPYGDSLVLFETEKQHRTGVSIIKEIGKAINEIDARHVVLDPITSITLQQTHAHKKRHAIGQLFGSLRKTGCTSLLTMETEPTPGGFYMEKFLADGVIILEKFIDKKFKLIRALRIEKMRGIQHDDQPRRYEITDNGMIVYHTEPVME